jgi:hypothetical protein
VLNYRVGRDNKKGEETGRNKRIKGPSGKPKRRTSRRKELDRKNARREKRIAMQRLSRGKNHHPCISKRTGKKARSHQVQTTTLVSPRTRQVRTRSTLLTPCPYCGYSTMHALGCPRRRR